MLKIKMPNHFIRFYTIEDLKDGDLFLHDNYVCMKIEKIMDELGEEQNAVILDSPCIGRCVSIDGDDEVIPLEGTLEIFQRGI